MIDQLESDRKGLWHGLRLQARVIGALLKREAATRFGGRQFGFSLAFLEPLAYIAIFASIRGFLRENIPFGESALLFMVTGLVILRLYMSIASKTMNAISANQALLMYPMVKPLDAIASRIILETIVMITIGVFVLGFISWYLDRDLLLNPAFVVEGLMVTLFLGASVGLFNAVFSQLFSPWTSIYGLLGLPIFLSSGLFYLPAELPPVVLDIIVWNPVLHCVEIFRGAMYVDYLSVAEPLYPIQFGIIALTIGLVLEKSYRNIIISR